MPIVDCSYIGTITDERHVRTKRQCNVSKFKCKLLVYHKRYGIFQLDVQNANFYISFFFSVHVHHLHHLSVLDPT
jgi:hypothetical protein